MRLKGGPSSILFPPLLSIIVPVGIQKKWESARDVQQWIFFRGRESIPKRVINALLATVRCSFTARKSDLKEHWPRNYAFLKRKSLEKKKKQRLGPVTLDFSRLFLTNRARFYSHLSREIDCTWKFLKRWNESYTMLISSWEKGTLLDFKKIGFY